VERSGRSGSASLPSNCQVLFESTGDAILAFALQTRQFKPDEQISRRVQLAVARLLSSTIGCAWQSAGVLVGLLRLEPKLG